MPVYLCIYQFIIMIYNGNCSFSHGQTLLQPWMNLNACNLKYCHGMVYADTSVIKWFLLECYKPLITISVCSFRDFEQQFIDAEI